MIVYLVECYEDFDSYSILGLYSSFDSAENFVISDINSENSYYWKKDVCREDSNNWRHLSGGWRICEMELKP